MGKPAQIPSETHLDASPAVRDTALSQLVGYNLKRSFNGIYIDLAEALRPLGLRMITFTILTMLRENPGFGCPTFRRQSIWKNRTWYR